ncbi:zinc ribbon domain-containing protein [Nocardia sp. R6R-6]|uniref:zinc ribbon domain-containing protein n=1 Tax=Nocardia sp. R6R-6 TaxID=3459303 RepID=UPI00403E33D7
MTAFAARRDDDSATWFDGLVEGRLLIRRCACCGHYSRPDSKTCPECLGAELAWVPAVGTGVVVCVIVDHAAGQRSVLGLVELDEGPWLHVRLAAPGSVAAGARGRFTVHPGEGEPIPVFVVDP